MLLTSEVTYFERSNVIDTCAVWHLIASRTLYTQALRDGCTFAVTHFVLYEALVKRPKILTDAHRELRKRLTDAQAAGQFRAVGLTIDDLQDVAVLAQRRNLGKGELSSIILAKKLGIAFTTDDRKAFNLGREVLVVPRFVQTIPQFLGWLIFSGRFLDGDKDAVVVEHRALGESHHEHFEASYRQALHFRLLQPPE